MEQMPPPVDPIVTERWQARFRAVRIGLPGWAEDRPARCLYTSDPTGTVELYAWDRDTGEHRQVTDRPNGTLYGGLDPTGDEVWWFDDTDGDEFGVWRRQPFPDGPTAQSARPAEGVAELPPSYPAGLEIGRTTVAVGRAADGVCSIHVADRRAPAAGARTLYRTAEDAHLGGLSRDETLVAVGHSEHGDSLHPDLRILRTADGGTVAELADGPGKGVHSLGFSPVVGDQRLLVLHERRGRPELLVWDTATDGTFELDLPLDGDLDASWYPDGSALLITCEHRARSALYRYDLRTGELAGVDTPAGVVEQATARPDGTVEYLWSDAASPRQVRVAGREEPLLTPPGRPAPPSVTVTDLFVVGPGGAVHALVAVPPGAARPCPTVVLVHGGPHWLDQDSFSAVRAAWIDHGYAVAHVNYRGSTGYGSAWRDAIVGRPGLTELEDVAAVHDQLVADGLADPQRSVLAGGSWGGYLTLLGLGTQPKRWAAGVAAVPVADYVTAYDDEMEPLKAFDRALFGGSPDDVPDVFGESNPLTYVDAVAAPVLVLVGENDPRCPARQVDVYLERLAKGGAPHEVYRFDAGHGSLVVTERIKQMAAELDFVRARVPAYP